MVRLPKRKLYECTQVERGQKHRLHGLSAQKSRQSQTRQKENTLALAPLSGGKVQSFVRVQQRAATEKVCRQVRDVADEKRDVTKVTNCATVELKVYIYNILYK